ncbi:hypothetical protein CI1B_42280 [Bradyrhizobium ivorense]|uniref:DUF3551 domain-containing protein n=1 Tax=Bradyrhizobium ivorense TaxID=2511166 RepID=A0A508TAT4_9BRAD|nr:DUF3551 domain-containing protein [Bradyrhizobium ivorense]VIO72154.1 hypothetical protein CI41S_35210 [Bradyrhizobium ivorense]VIO72582.1 hypothetical protein CI1B_42280 [Bradyrhizobium ivorense]
MNRPLLVLLAAVISVTAVSTASAGQRYHRERPVYAANDRFCLQGRIWGYPGNCQFATYGQCMATASGTDAYCDVNPQYYFARQGYYR